MRLRVAPYLAQRATWPAAGRHVLAQYDLETVVVYQAFSPAIGRFAAEHGYFGGAFSYERMSWVKPNFLWMMYRSGWGTKQGQEVTLAVHLRRAAFDEILAAAVHAQYEPKVYASRAVWEQAVTRSDVRLQWDPDHAPGGAHEERRAIQLGLRGEVLRKYGRDWLVAVEDISEFVATQRASRHAEEHAALVTPVETVYPVADAAVAARLGIHPAG